MLSVLLVTEEGLLMAELPGFVLLLPAAVPFLEELNRYLLPDELDCDIAVSLDTVSELTVEMGGVISYFGGFGVASL